MSELEYERGYQAGYRQGLQNGQAKQEPGQGVPLPQSITLESNYPDEEPGWTRVQVYRIEFTCGPPAWWCIESSMTTKRDKRGHSTRTWRVLSAQPSLRKANGARNGAGHGIGLGQRVMGL